MQPNPTLCPFQAAYTARPFPILPTQKAKIMHTPTKLLALIIPLALAACAVNTDVPSRVAVPPSFEQTSEQAGAIGQPENEFSSRFSLAHYAAA